MSWTAKQIVAVVDRRTRDVPVPEWGEGASVLIGEIGALARARLRDWWRERGKCPTPDEDNEPQSCDEAPPDKEYSDSDYTELMLRWLVECILDPATQQPAFTHADLEALGAKGPKALSRIYDAILELNLQTDEARADAEKNSPGTD